MVTSELQNQGGAGNAASHDEFSSGILCFLHQLYSGQVLIDKMETEF